MYGCGATGRQSCLIFGFRPVFLIQNDEKVPSGDQPVGPKMSETRNSKDGCTFCGLKKLRVKSCKGKGGRR